MTGDVTTRAASEAAVQAVPGPFGGPETLVNCVGIFDFYRGLSGEDHAWSYVFLASDRARGITGDVVHPGGGIAVKH